MLRDPIRKLRTHWGVAHLCFALTGVGLLVTGLFTGEGSLLLGSLLIAATYAAFVGSARTVDRAMRALADMAERVPGVLYRYRQQKGGGSRYEFISRDVGTILGTDRAAALNDPTTLLQHVLDADREPLVRAIRHAAETLEPFGHEFRLQFGDGRIRWLRSSARLTRKSADLVIWNGYWEDITNQKDAEAERDRFFTLSLDMLCVASDGHFRRLSPAFSHTLGWTAEELMSRPFIEFVHPDDVARTQQEIDRELRDCTPLIDFENRYRHKDGSWRVLSWRSVPRPEEGVMYASARDVTEQHRVRAELVKAKEDADAANRAKSTFLATMSHEIRTPLNGVLGMLELLSMTQLDSEQRATIEVVRRSGDSLKRIIDDILEFSKIEAGRLDIHAEPASVEAVIKAVRDIYSGLASSKGLALEVRIDPGISLALVVDALRLQQILNNFVSNALKFTSRGGIRIEAKVLERAEGTERVRFTVTDTGIGIPLETQQNLFQPFVQAETDTTRRFGGTGLGLTISRRLATLMDGTIELSSKPGSGTTVSVTLPMRIAHPDELPQVSSESALAALLTHRRRREPPNVVRAQAEGSLILLVDDHATNRSVLVRQLNLLGYAVETAEHGAQALERWGPGRYGLLIADCNMPVMDGYELARRIRDVEGREGSKRTPIIACTANALRGEAAACLAAGMDDYLAKPVRLAELQAKVDQWLPLSEFAPPEAEAASGMAPLAATATTAPALPVDRSVLAMISGGDETLAANLLQDFKRINDKDAAALELAIAGSNLQAARHAAHRMKGVSFTVGADALGRSCQQLEAAARAGEGLAIQKALAEFRAELQRLNAYIDRL